MLSSSYLQQSPIQQPQTLDSLLLHRSALSALSLPLPSSSLPPPPPPKLIPGTNFVIDGFRFCSSSAAYFLSHFHSDHYTGLSSTWSHGVVFCSPTTALLLTRVLNVPSHFVFELPLREPVVVDGCEVTLVDANHCPGAVQFLFKVPGKNCGSSTFEYYVHTGDFRYSRCMKDDSIFSRFVGCDAVFLDTTYCNPKFVFPSQEESIDYVVNVIESIDGLELVGGSEKKSVLFLVATYVVGKERILLEIARRCNRKIHVDRRKMEVLKVLGYGESGMFTEDWSQSDVHVVGWNVLGETWPYFRPNFVKMKEIMVERGYSRVVGFVPTGWTYEVKRNKFAVRSKDSFEIHLVPYSEHSNYDELREYVKLLRPKRVIPTVGVDVEKFDSKHVNKMQKHFAGLVDEMANKKEFLMSFFRGSSEHVESKVKVEMNDETIIKVEKDNESNVKVGVGATFIKDGLDQDRDLEGNDPGVILNSSTFQEDCSNISLLTNNEETERILQELRYSLPTWVTQDQMLDLINSSGMNIVEAISNFYENETEFHEQVFACKSFASTSQAGSVDNSETEVVPIPVSAESNRQSLSVTFSQKFKSSNIKSSPSPGKRKRNTDYKSSKKIKSKSKQESGGPKQSTITSFFSKSLPNASQGTAAESLCDDLLPNDDVEPYREEIDQFLCITGGDDSSRKYAAIILKRTGGDINKALDLHYHNSEGDHREVVETPIVSGNVDVVQPHTNKFSSSDKKNVVEEAEHCVDLPVPRSPQENVDATLVSLPPEKYDPIRHACWKAGQPAPYIHLARTFDLVEAEKGKIKATSMLCNMFRSLLALSQEDVLPAVYLCTNKIAADHENVDLNIGGSLVASAIEEACGTKRSRIRDMYNNMGDLGDVAQVCRQTQTLLAPPPPLLIKDVFSALQKISVQTGSGSTVRKKNIVMNLMRSCREKEIKFIVRTLVRNLRIGAMMRTILPALAQAVAINSFSDSSEQRSEISKEKLQCLSTAVMEAYNIIPSLDLVVPSLINKGILFSSSTLSMVPGMPIKPMLAKIANGISEALKLFQDKAFTCEYKYDGQRAQIHKLSDGTVCVFSRNGDETTSRFPDLVNTIQESCKPSATTFIVDAEVVAIDRQKNDKLMSFQELSSRERGSKDSLISLNNIKVEICVFVFDIMYANGKQLLEFPLRVRRKYLKDFFCNERPGYFEYAKEMTIEACGASLSNEATIMKINSFLEDAIHSSCEGIMIKSLDVDAGYSPSKRSDTWLKVKRDYVDGLNDSLDLVPIGAWHGNGRKAGWHSPYLMACYSPETEEFQSVCRVMSGFSDAFYTEMKEFFSEDKILSKKPPYYRTAEVPDVWFRPVLVWAIRGADFTVSPVHQAAVGLVHPSRGISIRFPRFIRTVPDRNPEECSTASDIADMFNSQTRKMDVTAGN